MIVASVSTYAAFDRTDAQKRLNGTGITGLVHAANSADGLYLMSYLPDPNNFFKRYFISLVPSTAEIRQTLNNLRRNDKIRVRGTLSFRKSSQAHLLLNELEVVESFAPGEEAPPTLSLGSSLPTVASEIERHDVVTALVHAVTDPDVLVVEIRNKVVPVYVKQPELVQGLGRGDLVGLRMVVRGLPSTPTHGQLVFQRKEGPQVVQVLESFATRNQQRMRVQGRLTLFPKSPLIDRDIWAVEEALPSGLFRYYTLVNFDSQGRLTPEMDVLSAKLRALWNSHSRSVVAGRNKLINNKVHISAEGLVMITTGDQANAQINLTASDIQRN